jgi:alpha/beta superfamily hydrolase
LDADARAVRDWIARHRQYKRVSVVGVSFGAAPALALKKSLGARADAYLVAPVVSLKLIRDLERPTLSFLNIGGKSHYAAFAEMVYGSEAKQDEFDRKLAEAYRSLSSTDHVFAGQQDAKSPAAEVRRLTSEARVHLMPGNHDLITGLQPIYERISDFIARKGSTPIGVEPN